MLPRSRKPLEGPKPSLQILLILSASPSSNYPVGFLPFQTLPPPLFWCISPCIRSVVLCHCIYKRDRAWECQPEEHRPAWECLGGAHSLQRGFSRTQQDSLKSSQGDQTGLPPPTVLTICKPCHNSMCLKVCLYCDRQRALDLWLSGTTKCPGCFSPLSMECSNDFLCLCDLCTLFAELNLGIIP